MPLHLEIYGLTDHRNLGTIDRFLDAYVDREARDWAGEQLDMVPLGRKKHSGRYIDEDLHTQSIKHDREYREQLYEYDCEPAVSLPHIIKRGLDYPRRSFTLYLSPNEKRLAGALIGFTVDDKLVLGLAVEDLGKRLEKRSLAVKLLKQLAELGRCKLGMVIGECPPPISEEEYLALQSTALYFHKFL